MLCQSTGLKALKNYSTCGHGQIIGCAGWGTCCLLQFQSDVEVGITQRKAKISINLLQHRSKHINTLQRAFSTMISSMFEMMLS